jgi:hypothetical protein
MKPVVRVGKLPRCICASAEKARREGETREEVRAAQVTVGDNENQWWKGNQLNSKRTHREVQELIEESAACGTSGG